MRRVFHGVRRLAREHWWLIVWALIILALLALEEFMPRGQAGLVWLELINGVIDFLRQLYLKRKSNLQS